MVPIRHLIIILTYAIALCGALPLFPWLTAVPRIFLVFSAIMGIWQDKTGRWPLKPWAQNTIIVPVFIFYALQYSRLNPVEPVVSVLAIMLALRIGGEKSVRHTLQIHALSLFCLASSSLFNLSPVFLIYIGLLLFLEATALVLLTFFSQDDAMRLSMAELKKVLAAALLMPLLSLPLTLFFFPLLPRTQLPLWNYLNSTAGIATGLSDKVEPGRQSSVEESAAAVLRAEMPRQSRQLYWRGTVFNRVEGNRWLRERAVPAENAVYTGKKIVQTIFPEPGSSKTLIALDRPSSISLNQLKLTDDGVYEYAGSAGKRLNYAAYSLVEGRFAPDAAIDRFFYLRLPSTIPVRIQELAADMKQRGTDDRARLEQLENYFRNGGFRYSIRDLPTGDRALERFLFETRQGHCEFFASSFAMLLRGAGVPSRLVGGYLGGDYNELGGYYLVSEKMAHVWVEAFIEGSGWVRIDPSSFAVNADAVLDGRSSVSFMRKVRQLSDSLNHAWNRTVIQYDFERQIDFVNYAGQRLQGMKPAESVRRMATYLAVILFVITACGVVAGRRLIFQSREERILKKFFRLLGRDSVSDSNRQGLFEIARESGDERAMEFVAIYAGAVYRDRRVTDDEYRQLRLILRQILSPEAAGKKS